VIGRGGLLGSALVRALAAPGRTVFQPAVAFRWTDLPVLLRQISAAVHQFGQLVEPGQGWEIYWAAGVGNMGSEAAALQPETQALQSLLDSLAGDARLARESGALAFASSAGAIYAGSDDEIITEQSVPSPNTAYGWEKLRQEDLLREYHRRAPHHRVLLARLSTVFGPRRKGLPPQGLFSSLARSMFQQEPVRIFVPLDTMRDYIYGDDAAQAMVTVLRAMEHEQSPLVKILASQRITTIADIVSIFKRIGYRRPRIVTGATILSDKYGGRVEFRTTVAPHIAQSDFSPIHVCAAIILEAERLAYADPAPKDELSPGADRPAQPPDDELIAGTPPQTAPQIAVALSK
jgi:UDP-glucose 4-epimerase